MTNFKCGSVAIATGATELTVSPALSFDPVQVVVSVRQPSSAAPLITAYVSGTPTATAFTVALSAPALETGYYLEWTAFATDVSPVVAGDTLAVSYDDLCSAVATYLGWDPENLSTTESATVDACVQSGVRRFYYPPSLEGVDTSYEWSFLRQSGTVDVTAGTDSYQLPNGFGRIAGQIVVDGECRPSIPVIPYGDILRMKQSGLSGAPRFAAVTCEQSFGSRGQMKRLHIYPCPDEDMTLSFVCDADTGKLDSEDRPFPLGGAMFAELVKESCLAVAEHDVNDTAEIHTNNYRELLVAMIQRDRRTLAQNFGYVGDRSWRFNDDPFVKIR